MGKLFSSSSDVEGEKEKRNEVKWIKKEKKEEEVK